MKHAHSCRIVQEAARQRDAPAWALYWDGAYCDHFASTQSARAAGLSLCSSRERELIELSVEDARGRRLSIERLVHEPASG